MVCFDHNLFCFGTGTGIDIVTQMELDECFREKDKLNEAVMRALKDTTKPWGVEAKRYEVTDIDASHEIKSAMNLQAAAERQRREKSLGAGPRLFDSVCSTASPLSQMFLFAILYCERMDVSRVNSITLAHCV